MSAVVAITFSLFNIIGKQLSLFEEEHTQILEYNLLNSALIGDIEKANDFYHAEGQLFLEYYNDTEIIYSINPHFVLRQNQVKTDTFRLKTIAHEFIGDASNNHSTTTLLMSFNVLNDTIKSNYFLEKDNAKIINLIYFNED